MKYPNLKEEKKLKKFGFKIIVGLDEAGRGPLAGPVIAAATIVATAEIKKQESKFKNLFKGIKDSKKLTPKKREEFYKILTKNSAIKWATGRTCEKVIDKINILEATKLAMKKAVKNLSKKLKKSAVQNSRDRGNFGLIDFLILDGNFKINSSLPQKSIIRADEKVFSCTAASILAKVTRDRIMLKYHKKYPKYGFNQHKGYPTKYHREALKKYGPCEIHRKSFAPVSKCKA